MKIVPLMLAALLIAGCAATNTGKFGGAIAGGNASIVARTKSIDETTDTIDGHAEQKQVIHVQTKGIRSDSQAIGKAVSDWHGYSQKLESDLAWYHRNPLVRFAVWLWYTLWLLPVAFIAYVAIGVMTHTYNPMKLLAGVMKAPAYIWRLVRGTSEP